MLLSGQTHHQAQSGTAPRIRPESEMVKPASKISQIIKQTKAYRTGKFFFK
jgi:hypothetical protein